LKFNVVPTVVYVPESVVTWATVVAVHVQVGPVLEHVALSTKPPGANKTCVPDSHDVPFKHDVGTEAWSLADATIDVSEYVESELNVTVPVW
jgi:hypothetical protein